MMRTLVILLVIFSLAACGGKGDISDRSSENGSINGSSASGSASSANASDTVESSSGASSSFDPSMVILATDYCQGGKQITGFVNNSSLANASILSNSSVSFSATSSQYYGNDCSEKPAFAYTPPEQMTNSTLDAGEFNVAISEDGELVFWGETRVIEAPEEMPPVAQVDMAELCVGVLHTDNTASLLLPADSAKMVRQVLDFTDVVALSAGRNHVLLLLEDGTVKAWGANDKGQTDIPADLNDVTAVSAGNGHSFALKGNGEVVHWGDPFSKPPADLKNIVAIDSNGHNNIAFDTEGRIHTWGNYNYREQEIPDGLTAEYGAVYVVAGSRGYLAKLSDGSLVRWYRGEYSDLPNWTRDINFKEVALGLGHVLAKSQAGELFAWGADESDVNLLGPSELMNIDRMSDGGSDPMLMRGNRVFNLNGYEHVIDNPPGSIIKSFQFNNHRFGVLYENGNTYVSPLAGASADNGWPLAQKPDQAVKEMVLGDRSNLYLLDDGSLVQFAFDGVIPLPEGIPGPINNLVGHQTSLTLENGDFFNWSKVDVSAEISIDTKNIVAYENQYPAHAALTRSGELLYWNALFKIDPQEGDSSRMIEELAEPRLIASDVKKFQFLLDGSVFILKQSGEIEFWNIFDGAALPRYFIPPAGLSNVINISASNDQFYALTEEGQLVVWGQEFYFPPNFYKLLTNY